jgi:hypothetical protein
MQVPGLYWLEAIPELQYLPSWIYPLPSMMKAMSNAGNKYWWGLLTEGEWIMEHDPFRKGFVSQQWPFSSPSLSGYLAGCSLKA